MQRIRLIASGEMEEHALVESLSRFFPRERAVRPGQVEGVEWHAFADSLDGFTGARLKPGRRPNSNALKLARAMLTATFAPKGQRSALVMVIQDLELANQDQPGLVVDTFRRALIAELQDLRDKGRAPPDADVLIRSRCSFHLMAPMPEGYFFGEAEALRRAGVASPETVRLKSDDLEDFEALDLDWSPTCMRTNERKQAEGNPWWREERHPAQYLSWLNRRQQSGGYYKKTVHGSAALRALAWPQIPAHADATPFARALFLDLSDWFGLSESPLGSGAPAPQVWTSDPAVRLLRNA